MTRRGYPTQDGRRAAEIGSRGSGSSRSTRSGPEGGLPIIERAIDETIAALSAEAVGAMSEALAMTVEYLKTRKQFGVTIGSFQALQHRASDMVVALEQARSMMYPGHHEARLRTTPRSGQKRSRPPRSRSGDQHDLSVSRPFRCTAGSR